MLEEVAAGREAVLSHAARIRYLGQCFAAGMSVVLDREVPGGLGNLPPHLVIHPVGLRFVLPLALRNEPEDPGRALALIGGSPRRRYRQFQEAVFLDANLERLVHAHPGGCEYVHGEHAKESAGIQSFDRDPAMAFCRAVTRECRVTRTFPAQQATDAHSKGSVPARCVFVSVPPSP